MKTRHRDRKLEKTVGNKTAHPRIRREGERERLGE